jgi:predicted 3-demethylubiquinone-9 3-methyltransferase (glyoxalase superfamily)
MQKITPFLWFDNQAEEAMNFYTSVFKNSKVVNVQRFENSGPDMKSTVITGTFEIEGQEFMVLNGGPEFKFTEAISFFVKCKDQAEVDELWNKLTADGGQESQCGWLKDKFGVSWQIIPDALGEMLGNPDPLKAQKAMKSMLQMKKIDIAKMKEEMEQE